MYNYKGGPCYRCLFPKPPPPETVTRCSDGGVLGAGTTPRGLSDSLGFAVTPSPRVCVCGAVVRVRWCVRVPFMSQCLALSGVCKPWRR